MIALKTVDDTINHDMKEKLSNDIHETSKERSNLYFLICAIQINSASYKCLLCRFAYEKYAATRKKERPFFYVKILGEGNN